MKTQNLAVMITDIKGFTAKTSRQTREENALMLRRHDALLVPVLRAFGGRRIKTMGDAFLVVFSSPTNSLLCGMAIQDRLWDYNRRVAEDDRIEVRIAVNMGEVRVVRSLSATDVFGEPVNIAARVEAEADAGEICFTEAIYLVMNKAEIPAEEIGYRELRGLPERIRLYRVARGRYELATTTPALHMSALEPLPQPPYGNLGLARVKGLSAPDPAALDPEPPSTQLDAAVEKLRPLRAALSRRWVKVAAAVVLLIGAVALVLVLRGSRIERLIADGELAEAKHRIDDLAHSDGDSDPEVLYLRGKLEQERARRGRGSAREAFELFSQAAAVGSGPALRELGRQAQSKDCNVRRLAARALADTHSSRALPALRGLAEEEPEAERGDALDQVKRFFGADGRCGAGDLARSAIQELEDGR
jgi:class 3 adenylate cyclase